MVTLEFNHLFPLHFHKGRAADDEVWQRWSGARTAELWQAIALLCAVDPDSLTLKKARSVNYIIWRLELAVAELNHGLLDPLIRFPEEPRRSIVRFDYVRRWAQINMIGIPERYPIGGEPIDLRLLDGPAATPREPDQQQPAPATPDNVVATPVELAELPKPRRRRPKPNGASEYMRESELLEALPFSRATLWRRVKEGEFPAPIKLGGNLNAWKRAEVTKWSEAVEAGLEKKKAKRS
jgi:prophage regulatory protein